MAQLQADYVAAQRSRGGLIKSLSAARAPGSLNWEQLTVVQQQRWLLALLRGDDGRTIASEVAAAFYRMWGSIKITSRAGAGAIQGVIEMLTGAPLHPVSCKAAAGQLPGCMRGHGRRLTAAAWGRPADLTCCCTPRRTLVRRPPPPP